VKFSYKDIHLVKRAMEYQKVDLLNVRKDPEQVQDLDFKMLVLKNKNRNYFC